jgi:hypothetical protein
LGKQIICYYYYEEDEYLAKFNYIEEIRYRGRANAIPLALNGFVDINVKAGSENLGLIFWGLATLC